MPIPFRSSSPLVALTFMLAGLGCGSSPAEPQRCTTSTECSAGSRCISSACVVNRPPGASISLPAGAIEATLLLEFDGSASADPDPGDSIATRQWTFRAVAASCAPPVVAGDVPRAQVRFACPGTYAVDLAVTDQLAAQGLATKEFTVGAYSGPALLVLGPDVVVDHACTTGPAHCAPTGPVALSASPTADAPAGLTYLWTVEPPPGLPLDATRRVTFVPGPGDLAPTVTIETDGQAISGDWIFRVEGRDAIGVAASGAIRVSVGNRLPVLTPTIPVPNHTFDGLQFAASGEVPFTVTDPDGDALLAPAVEWRHVGDGTAATFTGVLLDAPARVTFSIVVPYTGPADALSLIGGPLLERSIRFSVSDVNGGVAAGVWPIVVGNRPPSIVSAPAPAVVDHTYDPVAGAYRASPTLTTWTDPDGDPLVQVPGSDTGDLDCPSFDVPAGGVAIGRCSLPSGITPPALVNFAGLHNVAQRVQDPWAEAALPSTVQFTIGNRPPVITSTAPYVSRLACTFTGCCNYVPAEGCLLKETTSLAGTDTVPSRWSDPDGDPIDVRVAAGPTITPVQPLLCLPPACALTMNLVAAPGICGDIVETLTMSVTDGVDVTSGSLPVQRTCPTF